MKLLAEPTRSVRIAAVQAMVRSRTGIKYAYQEPYRSGLTAEKLAAKVLEMDKEGICSDNDPTQIVAGENLSGIYDSAAWNNTGIGNAAGEGRAQIMNNLGCRWPAS